MVALVGRSGAGKTTVTDLVARFHDPTKGRILVNGSDIREFRLRTYRDLLAIVQQDVFLFDGSVRDNIAYGRHDATDAEVEDAARRANAHEFIVRLPEQYDTFICLYDSLADQLLERRQARRAFGSAENSLSGADLFRRIDQLFIGNCDGSASGCAQRVKN